jgi:hypothetical protein
MWQLGPWCIAVAALAGCGERAPQSPTTPAAPAAPAPTPNPPAAREPFDETRGYLHKPSGVGFVYPDGWERTPLRSEGPLTSFGLNKQTPRATVTLYWTESDQPLDGATVGQNEYEALRPHYGTKLGKPEPIQVGGQKGFKLSIDGGPLGQIESDLVGVIYVFAVRKGGQWWKVKLRATVPGRENLALLVEPLLANYRW